jgi:hypothetical protein
MKSSQDTNDSVRVSDVTPHNRALYEAGKSLLIDSVKTGMDFCKFMIGVATGAIPTYLALLKLAVPQAAQLSRAIILVALIPPVLFLFAAVVFVIGFFPRTSRFSLDIVDEIDRERNKTIARRRCCAIIGFIAFCLGTVCSIAILAFVATSTPNLAPRH